MAKRIRGLLLAAAALPAMAAAQDTHPAYGSFGFDTAGMDRSVRPGDDFYAYANGNWQRTTQIPADRSSWGEFAVLQELSQNRTRTILDAASAQPGSKIGDFYASFLDTTAADAKGITPLAAPLAAIDAAADRPALAREMALLDRIGVTNLFGTYIAQDDRHPDVYVPRLVQSGLGLPNRDYYLNPGSALEHTRAAYLAYVTKLLTLSGTPDAATRAQAIVDFETAIARVHWTPADSRESDKTYNRMTPTELAGEAPGFAWSDYLSGAGIAGQGTLLVSQPSAFTGEAKLFAATPPPVLRDYLRFHLIDSYAAYLSQPFVEARFVMRGTELTGQPEDQARWKRGVDLVSREMGEAVGEVYVARYFPPEAKAAADALVANIIAAMRARIPRLTWMDQATKARALEKLASFRPKIGYPAHWRDYSALRIDRTDLVGNVMRANEFETQRDLNKLGRPIDRDEWGMAPMAVNAYANFTMDEIVFPAAILQPPFFDPRADSAVNYGGIGVVIGHELSHHFDDQGRKYDSHGALTDWWTTQDITRFDAFTARLAAQYDAYEPLPGVHVNGRLTLGENMADLAGLSLAHDAWTLSLGGTPAPVLDGFTGEQRFYLGYAQVWRTKYRDPALRQQLLTNPHSPGEQRTDEVRNKEDWVRAFAVTPDEKLYLPPAERVNVW